MKRFQVVLAVICLIGLPVMAFAQTDPCQQARADARKDIKSGLWTAAGCLAACLASPLAGLGVVGLAHLVKPSVPSENLLGKPWEYTEAYTSCYQEEMKELQKDEAIGGCITGSLLIATTAVVVSIIGLSSLAFY